MSLDLMAQKSSSFDDLVFDTFCLSIKQIKLLLKPDY